jgi:hypothetical protein
MAEAAASEKGMVGKKGNRRSGNGENRTDPAGQSLAVADDLPDQSANGLYGGPVCRADGKRG